jgi:hypothetical protein
MKKLTSLAYFVLIHHFSFCQFGISTPKFTGKDADQMKLSWSLQVSLTTGIPISLNKKKANNVFLVIRPGVKFNWMDFNENNIIERQNGYTNFVKDVNINHKYNNGFLKTSSQMRSSVLSLPINLAIKIKNVKNLTIAPGIFTNYLIGGHFKRKYTDNNGHQSITNRFKNNQDYYGLQRLQYGICGHIRYKYIIVYGVFPLTTLFKENQGIEVRQSEVGVVFNIFWKKLMPFEPY